MRLIPEPHRPRGSVGSPEEYVRQFTDDVLRNDALVRRMTRGLHWDPEPERFLAAAAHELQVRKDLGVAFSWVKL